MEGKSWVNAKMAFMGVSLLLLFSGLMVLRILRLGAKGVQGKIHIPGLALVALGPTQIETGISEIRKEHNNLVNEA